MPEREQVLHVQHENLVTTLAQVILAVCLDLFTTEVFSLCCMLTCYRTEKTQHNQRDKYIV